MKVLHGKRQTMPGLQVCTVVVLGFFTFIKSTTGLHESPTSHTPIMNSVVEDEVI